MAKTKKKKKKVVQQFRDWTGSFGKTPGINNPFFKNFHLNEK